MSETTDWLQDVEIGCQQRAGAYWRPADGSPVRTALTFKINRMETRVNRSLLAIIAICLAHSLARAQTGLQVQSVHNNGTLLWTDQSHTNWLYTVEWSADLTSWYNSWQGLRLFTVSLTTNATIVPMHYRISKIRAENRVLSLASLVGRSVAFIGFDSNRRVDFTTSSNALISSLDSPSGTSSAAYVYYPVDTTNSFLNLTPPGFEGQMHWFTDAGGTLDAALGRGFFLLE